MKSKKIYLIVGGLIITTLIIITKLQLSNQPEKIDLGKTNDMFNAASPTTGEQVARACVACHSLHKGEPHQVGPNLYGIVGAKIARKTDYAYSENLLKLKDKHWTIDNLDEWLKDPREFVPGTKMSFAGLLDPQERMDLISYLHSLNKDIQK